MNTQGNYHYILRGVFNVLLGFAIFGCAPTSPMIDTEGLPTRKFDAQKDIALKLPGRVLFDDPVISADGNLLASITAKLSNDGRYIHQGVYLWSLLNNNHTFLKLNPELNRRVYSIVFSPNSELLAINFNTSPMYIYNVQDLQFDARYSYNGSKIPQQNILSDGTKLYSIPGSRHENIQFNPDGSMLAFGISTSTGYRLVLADVNSREIIKNLEKPDDFYIISSIEFSPNGKYLTSYNNAEDLVVGIWDVNSGNLRRLLSFVRKPNQYIGNTMDILDTYFLSDDKIIIIKSYDSYRNSKISTKCHIEIWDWIQERKIMDTNIEGYYESIVSHDKAVLAIRHNSSILILDTSNFVPTRQFTTQGSDQIKGFAFHPNNKLIIISIHNRKTEINTIIFWDIKSGELVNDIL